MFSFLALFPDTSIYQAFSINTLHRWVSQMGRLRPKGRNTYQEKLWGMSVAPVCFSLWGFSSQQPELSLLPPHALLEVAFPLLSDSCQKPHAQAMSDARWEINNRYFLVAVYSVCRWIFHLTQSSTALLWHTNALECPGLYCFSAKEPNKNSSKKASSSVSPF